MDIKKQTEKKLKKKAEIEAKEAKRKADLEAYRLASEALNKSITEAKTQKAIDKKEKKAIKEKSKIKPEKEPQTEDKKPEKEPQTEDKKPETSKTKEFWLFKRFHFSWNNKWIETYKFEDFKSGKKDVRTEIGRYALIIPILIISLLILLFGI